ncbi:MAG: hypothetical protein KF861_17460 [Planctomycetaceae bacterium]|nr:hypothetical protein [Planctomycetaceae bacterium]
MSVAARQPSSAWEAIRIADRAECVAWAWYRPALAPQSVHFQIPEDVHRSSSGALTLRRLLEAGGIASHEALSWTILGMTYPVLQGANPLLDQPLPVPGPAGISVQIASPLSTVPTIVPPLGAIDPVQEPSGAASPVLEALNAEWLAIVQIERQVDALRRQLGSVQGTLQSLNRDLDPDERLYSDSQEKREWQDARRWLRDALSQVSKAIRAHDIGVTSAAGNRRRFEQLYKDFIEPRQPFPGMDVERMVFEQHRKNNSNLVMQMQSAHAFAARDGVQRAQAVLSRIAARVRGARAKR